jgi:hypothetical protein
MFLGGQVNKKYPETINDDKQNIIFENDNSKFYIPDEYEDLYIIPKKDFITFKNSLNVTQVHPIFKNESDQILDFDTYTIDSEEGKEALKKNILYQKKYVRSDEKNDLFKYKPSTTVVLNPLKTIAVLNPLKTIAVLNPLKTIAVINPLKSISPSVNPQKNVAVFVKKTTGGKKIKKSKKTRKHKGIIQTGGNTGRLRKGYKYSGKRLKNGMPEILKVKSVNKK